jgi:hypothetical protein
MDNVPSSLVPYTLLLYRAGNADSLEFARYYQQLHNLDDDQLFALPCSESEVLADYNAFKAEIENPLKTYLLTSQTIYVFVVGYGVPGGFQDSSHTISTTSRLSMLNTPHHVQIDNPLFNRIESRRFSVEDAANVLIASRIDAPSLSDAKKILDNTQVFIQRGKAAGTFYFDKWANNISISAEDWAWDVSWGIDAYTDWEMLSGTDDEGYKSDLDSFESRILPNLNLPTFKTQFWDAQTDPVIPSLENDSFMWAWKADRSDYSFFKENTSQSRVFLYNADLDGGFTLRSDTTPRFPVLAMNSGYVGCAGALSSPSSEGYLRPRPFFECLLRGGTVGEAFLFACPFLNWTITLVGDPLVKVNFPVTLEISDIDTVNIGWDKMLSHITDAIAYQYKSNQNYKAIADLLFNYHDFPTKVELLSPFYELSASFDGTWKNVFVNPVSELFDFVTREADTQARPLINYLADREIKVSVLTMQVLDTPDLLSSIYLFPEGYWVAEDTIEHPYTYATIYHFELQASTDANFSNIFLTALSANEPTDWNIETEPGKFSAFTTEQIPSSYAGRRIKYTSRVIDYLPRGTKFYYRIRQLDVDENPSAFRTYQTIVST